MTNLEIVEKAYDLFGKGDMDSLRSLMDDKISFITYGDYSHAGSYVGPDEVIEKNFSVLAQNIPTLSITPSDYGRVKALFLLEWKPLTEILKATAFTFGL
jgi:ketosteroid isomerase-like protein